MYKFRGTSLLIVLLLLLNINHPLVASEASFLKKISKIQKEINNDDVKEATRLLGKLKTSTEDERDRVNILFGDIYVKINQPGKAIEFYEKSFFTANEKIENLASLGLAEAYLQQGKLVKAIDYAEKSLLLNSDIIKTKIVLAIARTRNGDKEQALELLEDLYMNQKNNAEVNLAIAGYHSSFDNNEEAIKILKAFLKRSPNNIKVMNELANQLWLLGNNDEAIALKYKIYKHYTFTGNRYFARKIKIWILSVDPEYFAKKGKPKIIRTEKSKEYEEKEIKNYDENKIVPQFEEFDFVYNFSGSGFIVGKGEYVITNNHVIDGAKRIAVRNGNGKISEARVAAQSKDYDLAILELIKPYHEKFAIKSKNFSDPKEGIDVLSIGYPLTTWFGNDRPVITEGIVSKVFDDKTGIFLTTTNVNAGNSGGPVFNLNGQLVGITAAALDKDFILKKTGRIPNAMGIAIKSNMLKEVFNYKITIPIKNVSYDKSKIYEMMLPSIVFVAVLVEEEEKKNKYIQKKKRIK
jgi:S1-C subfamily serine protease